MFGKRRPLDSIPTGLITKLAGMLQKDRKALEEARSLSSWMSCGISRVKVTEEDVRSLCPELGSSFKIQGWSILVQGADGLWRTQDVPYTLSLSSLRSSLLYLKSFQNPLPKDQEVTVQLDCHPSLYSAVLSSLPFCHWEVIQSSLIIRLRSVFMFQLGIPCKLVTLGMGNPTTSFGRGSFSCMVRFVRGQDRCSCLTFDSASILCQPNFSPCCDKGCGFSFNSPLGRRFTRFPGASFGVSVFPCDVHRLRSLMWELEGRKLRRKKVRQFVSDFLLKSSLHYYDTWESVLRGFGFPDYESFAREWSSALDRPPDLKRVPIYLSIDPIQDVDFVPPSDDLSCCSHFFPDLRLSDSGDFLPFCSNPVPGCALWESSDPYSPQLGAREFQRLARVQPLDPILKRTFKKLKVFQRNYQIIWSDPNCLHSDTCGCSVSLRCLYPEASGQIFYSSQRTPRAQISDLVTQLDRYYTMGAVVKSISCDEKDFCWDYFRRVQALIRQVADPTHLSYLRHQRRKKWWISVLDGWVYCYTVEFLFSFPENSSDEVIKSYLVRTALDIKSTGVILSCFSSSFEIVRTPDFWSLQGRGSYAGVNFSGPSLVDVLLDMYKRGFVDDPSLTLKVQDICYSSCLTDGQRSELITKMVQVMQNPSL